MEETQFPCSSSPNEKECKLSGSIFTQKTVVGNRSGGGNECADFESIKSQDDINVLKMAEGQDPSCSRPPNEEKINFKSFVFTCERIVSGTCKSEEENQSTELKNTIQPEMTRRDSVCYSQVVDRMFKSTSKDDLQANLYPLVLVSNGDGTSDTQNSIIGDREILKKTDAYKHAEEEEWASRRRELQIQAEEAKRLHKRRKAGAIRLLDMERRQKQRVEEVRESQKKDEQTLNLREQLCAGVRRELENLEVTCRDMASVLHGLGIDVEGGHNAVSSQALVSSSALCHDGHLRYALLINKLFSSSIPIEHQEAALWSKLKLKKNLLISRAKEKFML